MERRSIDEKLFNIPLLYHPLVALPSAAQNLRAEFSIEQQLRVEVFKIQ